MSILRARLYAMEQGRVDAAQSETRRDQVGSGDRSEKIRTYNFPQNRLTDHRIGFTSHDLSLVMEGRIEPLVEALAADDLRRRLEESGLGA